MLRRCKADEGHVISARARSIIPDNFCGPFRNNVTVLIDGIPILVDTISVLVDEVSILVDEVSILVDELSVLHDDIPILIKNVSVFVLINGDGDGFLNSERAIFRALNVLQFLIPLVSHGEPRGNVSALCFRKTTKKGYLPCSKIFCSV